MYTVVETPSFQKQADKLWSEDERLGFIRQLALNPERGNVIPNAEGARKIRWSVRGSGKSGGVRIIYFNQTDEGLIYLLAMYRKNERENMPADEIKKRRNHGY